jgi:phenylpyruvate tautomerase PptA (4-oxalocrotonate tautomerase family)
MPLNHVTLTPDAVDAAGRQSLVVALTEAALRAESVPDTPEARLRSILVVHDQPAGSVFWGGAANDERLRAVFVDFVCSAGVLDAARKDRFAAELQAAAEATTRPGDARPIFTSVIFHEVNEGDWGRQGAIQRLPEMARAAGFGHLTSIASA